MTQGHAWLFPCLVCKPNALGVLVDRASVPHDCPDRATPASMQVGGTPIPRAPRKRLFWPLSVSSAFSLPAH